MNDGLPLVENEIDDHKTDLDNWVDSVKKAKISESHSAIAERFVRDCNTLVGDMQADRVFSAADLCDFNDSKNSLEIRYNSLIEEAQDNS